MSAQRYGGHQPHVSITATDALDERAFRIGYDTAVNDVIRALRDSLGWIEDDAYADFVTEKFNGKKEDN